MDYEWCVSRPGHPTATFPDYVTALHFYLKVLGKDEIKPYMYQHGWLARDPNLPIGEPREKECLEDLCAKMALIRHIRDWE